MAHPGQDGGIRLDAERPADREAGTPDVDADPIDAPEMDAAVDAPLAADVSEDGGEDASRHDSPWQGTDARPGPGEACGAHGVECASGFCLDYRCCDSPCTGACMACRKEQTGLPDGQCGPVLSGTDPDGECEDQGRASCGTSGACNGAGGCATYPDGTICQTQVCGRESDPICSYACAAGRCDTAAPLPTSCGSGDLKLSDSLQLAPAADGQQFVRCGTLGQEPGGWQVAVSPDGRRLAARTRAGTVRLIATDTWQELAQLASPLGQIDAVAFSPDGAHLATLSADMGTTNLWRAEDGSLEHTFAAPAASLVGSGAWGLSFSSDGQRLATSQGIVIHLTTGKTTDWSGREVTYSLGLNPQAGGVGSARPSTIRFMAGNALFVERPAQGGANSAHSIGLVDVSTGTPTYLAHGHTSPISGFALSRDGQWVALGRSAEMGFGLRVYRASTGEEVAADPSPGQVMAFSPSGEEIYTTGGEGMQVRRRATLQVVRTFPWQTPSRLLGVSPRGELVVSTGGETLFIPTASGYPHRRLPVALDAIAWSDNGQIEVGTARDGRYFHVWRTGDAAELCAPVASPAPAAVSAAASSRDGSWVALGRRDGMVEVVSTTGGASTSIATGRGELIRVAVSSDGRRVATLAAGEPRTATFGDHGCYGHGPAAGLRPLDVFEVASGRKLRTLVLPEAFCDFVLSGDGQLVAHTDGSIRGYTHVYLDSHVRVVAVDTGEEKLRIGPTEAESTARGGTYTLHGFSPESARLAVGASGGITAYRLIDGGVDRSYPDLATGRLAAVSPGWTLLASRHGEIGPHAQNLRVLGMADSAALATFDVGGTNPPYISLGDSWAGALVFLLHANAQDWGVFKLWDVPSGQLLRIFGNSVPLPVGPDRLATNQGTNLALWCR